MFSAGWVFLSSIEGDEAELGDGRLGRAELGEVDRLALEGLRHRHVARAERRALLRRVGDAVVLERARAQRVRVAVGREAPLELVLDGGQVAHLREVQLVGGVLRGRRTRSCPARARSPRTVMPFGVERRLQRRRVGLAVAGDLRLVVEAEARSRRTRRRGRSGRRPSSGCAPGGSRGRTCARPCSRRSRGPGRRSRPSAWTRRSCPSRSGSAALAASDAGLSLRRRCSPRRSGSVLDAAAERSMPPADEQAPSTTSNVSPKRQHAGCPHGCSSSIVPQVERHRPRTLPARRSDVACSVRSAGVAGRRAPGRRRPRRRGRPDARRRLGPRSERARREPALDEGEQQRRPRSRARRRGSRRRRSRCARRGPGSSPSKMNRPSPPPPRIAPIVAVAMTWSVAVRKPPTMIDDAIGSSIRREDLALAQAHPAAGLDEVAVDRAQAGVASTRGAAGSPGTSSPGRSAGRSSPNVGVVAEDRREVRG